MSRRVQCRSFASNPVRAAMGDDPAHYRWSSYRSHALGQSDPRLTPHALYRALGRGDKGRQSGRD